MAAMELEQFVTVTLTQIMSGIKTAMSKVEEQGGKINPTISIRGDHKGHLTGSKISPLSIESVQFDVALTVSEGTGSTAGIAVVAGIFGGGARGTSSEETSQVSRVKFAIPVQWPQHTPST